MDNGTNGYYRYLNGEKDAFDEVMKAYFDNLVYFIDRYVHDTATAEDIAIDSFLELLVHPKRYNFTVSLKTYLFMIGRCRALNYIKHQKKWVMVELSQVEQDLIEREDLEERILADERKQIINEALEQLPEDMKIVIHLLYFEQLSHEETAKVMKKNRKQVYNLAHRAKERLRTILGKEWDLL